ncbi:MAG TPA: ABC transporter ATP-binding protein [Anaerolineae bacterium]|nr:ABC transporter ATP-binding protein [Anaerolineae bacterium]
MREISKSFPGVVANDRIDFDIFRSEIHALLGENGAGKSTLMKILYGFYRADSGRIFLDGKPVSIQSPNDARALQIGMVFQDFTLIPAFSVAENIALFLPDLSTVVNLRDVSRWIEEMSTRYGLRVNPHAMVNELSIGEQQKVEILKLILSDSRLLILDEPTRVLAPHEVDALFEVLYSMRQDGYAIILITHKIKEVLECADRITVLHNGCVAGSLVRSNASEDKLVEMMFGRKLSGLKTGKKVAREETALPILELHDVYTHGEGAETKLEEIDLKVYPGEIVGIAGVSGNGQRELGDVVLGVIKCVKGTKHLFGKDVTNSSIQKLRRSLVSFIPENPLTMAAAPYLTVLENMAVTKTWHYALRGGLAMDWQAIKTDIENTMERLGFSFSLNIPARSLSGGNLQRMIIVRELTHDPRLIIASYLTRGLDVQSTIAARQALIQARDDGAGVLLISEDLEELFLLSDRLIVLYGGRIVGSFKPDETNFYEVGHLMTGSEVQDAANA